MRRTSHAFFLVTIMAALTQTGCMGLILRSVMTNDIPFSQMHDQLPQITNGSARVWIYSLGGGPNVFNTMGRVSYISLGQTAYEIHGNTYTYIDTPAEETRFTTSGTCPPTFRADCRPGRIKQNINLQTGTEYFVRVKFPESGPLYDLPFRSEPDLPFDQVDLATTSIEIESLSYAQSSSQLRSKKELRWKEQ